MTDRTDSPPQPDRLLDHELGRAAYAYELPAGDLDVVLRRGGVRAHRRRRTLAGLTAVALVATTVGAIDLLDGGDREVSVASGGGLARGDVGIVWRTVSPSSGLGYTGGPDAGSGSAGPLYALSTAPGLASVNGPMPRVVWRSDDGVEWTAVAGQAKDLYLADLATGDGRVYAVGTGPATAAVGGRSVSPLLVGWSDDGAKTWNRELLPIDLAALSGRATRAGVVNTAVASGPAGTVVAGVLSATLDVPAVLPAGATAPNGWALTDTGVDVLGPEREVACPEGSAVPPEDKAMRQEKLARAGVAAGAGDEKPVEVGPSLCLRGDGTPVQVSPQDAYGVEASYTWEQLQVEGDLLRAVRSQPVAFRAAPGSERFERVDLPAVDQVGGPLLLDAGGGGFDLVTTTMSLDREEGTRTSGLTILRSADGRSWAQSLSAPGADVWAGALGRVGGVATIVGQGPTGAVLVRADGAGDWTGSPLIAALEAGVPDGAEMHVMSAAMGPFGIVVAVNLVSEERAGDRPPEVEQRILVSRDGTTWGDHAVTDLAGRPVKGVIRASVVGERAVVAVSVTAKDGDRPEQIVLVGTPS